MVDIIPATDSALYRLPMKTRQRLAADFGDPATPEGAVLTDAMITTRGFISDADVEFATIHEAFAALSVGGTLEIRENHTLSSSLVVDKACILRFAGGSLTASGSNVTLVSIASDNVAIESPKLIGAGESVSGTGRGIKALGTLGTRLSNITITNPDISEINYIGIEMRLVNDVRVLNGTIHDIGYSAVSFLSVTRGYTRGIDIHDVTEVGAYVNSYGITFSNWDATEPPSRDCIAEDNTIARIPWEGLDTHGGISITFRNNIINECGVGIAVVGGPGNLAAKDAQVRGNQIDYIATTGSRSGGIVFVGPNVTAGDPPLDLATGTIVGNTVARSGSDSSLNGGIIIYNTQSVVLDHNRIVEPAVNGIVVNFNNFDFVITNNTIVDVWSASILTSAIYIGQFSNNGITNGNSLSRASKTATRINEYGMRFNSSATVGSVLMGPNNWALAATPLSDSNGATRHDSLARAQTVGVSGGKVAFYGGTGQVKPAPLVQTYSTASRTHAARTATTVVTTPATVGGYGFTEAQANAIVAALNSIIGDSNNTAQFLNALVDDDQANGLR